MKISRDDPFDLNLCIRGLGVLTTYMHSDIYEYIYYFTFKKVMKSYAKDFNDAWEQYLDEDEFFEKIEDPFVQNALKTQFKLMEFKLELIRRFGFTETEDLEDAEIIIQAQRFKPYILIYKRAKSYKKLKLYYERTLEGIIACLYSYAAAITVQRYKIPLVFKRQFNSADQSWSRLLNTDDNNVLLLEQLILGLKEDLDQLRLLLKK